MDAAAEPPAAETAVGPKVAVGAEGPGRSAAKSAKATRDYVNLRLGVATSGAGAILCAEVSPLAFLSASACGVGSGFISHSTRPTMMLIQGHVRLAHWDLGLVSFEPRVGAGFAEVQEGEDELGFYFDGPGPTGVETAGPATGMSLRALVPLYGGFEFVGVLALDAAYFHFAPELVKPLAQWQPSASLTMGVGF